MTVAHIVVRIRQNALIPPMMYSSFPCGLALPLTMALTFSVREPAGFEKSLLGPIPMLDMKRVEGKASGSGLVTSCK